jgi:hypothetical protein
MELIKMILVTTVAVVGLPLLIVGVTLLGPVGWVAAAIVVPIAALVAIVVVSRRVGAGDDDRS